MKSGSYLQHSKSLARNTLLTCARLSVPLEAISQVSLIQEQPPIACIGPMT